MRPHTQARITITTCVIPRAADLLVSGKSGARCRHQSCRGRSFGSKSGLRGKTDFTNSFKMIAPVHPFLKKISLSFFQKSCFHGAVPPRHEGRIAIVTTRGVGCDGRDCISRRLVLLRTVKSCGRGIPTLMPSATRVSCVVAIRWPKSPAHRREHEAAVTPLRREGRYLADPVVLPRAFCCTRTMGISGYPAFPAPSF